jgi:hypothetical protein
MGNKVAKPIQVISQPSATTTVVQPPSVEYLSRIQSLSVQVKPPAKIKSNLSAVVTPSSPIQTSYFIKPSIKPLNQELTIAYVKKSL